MRRDRVPEGQMALFALPEPPIARARPLAATVFMQALTLYQPWLWAILGPPEHRAKRIENRPWKPPQKTLGGWIALHASAATKKAYEERITQQIYERTGLVAPPPEDFTRGTIAGLARVVGCVEESDDPWFLGPIYNKKKNYGWVLTDVIAIPRPVPCRGFQRLWGVPSRELQEVLDQVA